MCNKIKTCYTEHLNEIVIKYSKIYGFDMGPDGRTSYNNEGDAFKHCFMSAEFTLWLCPLISKIIGIEHENSNPKNPEKERKMDLWNNNHGIEIGKKIKKAHLGWLFKINEIYDKIAEDIIKEMKNGELITSLDDPRLN